MRIYIDSTDKVVSLNGIPARIWQGHTDSGIEVHCYVTRIAVANDARQGEFERELQSHAAPRSEVAAIPLRNIL